MPVHSRTQHEGKIEEAGPYREHTSLTVVWNLPGACAGFCDGSKTKPVLPLPKAGADRAIAMGMRYVTASSAGFDISLSKHFDPVAQVVASPDSRNSYEQPMAVVASASAMLDATIAIQVDFSMETPRNACILMPNTGANQTDEWS